MNDTSRELRRLLYATILCNLALWVYVLFVGPLPAQRELRVLPAAYADTPSKPIPGGAGENWEVSAPGANTDAITDIVWEWSDPARVYVQVDTDSVVNVMVTRDGVENPLGLNRSVALTAGSEYGFDVDGLMPGDTINVQCETNTAFAIISIRRVSAAGR